MRQKHIKNKNRFFILSTGSRPVRAAVAALSIAALAAARQPAFPQGPAAAPAKKPVELVIGIREFLSDLPAMIAAADGLYEREGVNVRTLIKPQGKDNEPLMLDGTLDLAVVGSHIGLNVLSKAGKDNPFVILACLGGGGRRWRLMASERSGISSLEGLQNKRLGIWPSSYGYHLLERHLAGKGIRYSPVRIPMKPELAVEFLEKGKVDALLAWEPIPALLEDRKLAHEIFNLEGMGAGVPVYLAARKDVVRKNPAGVALVLRTLYRATTFVRENPEQAVRRAAATLRLPPRVLKKALRNHQFRFGLTCRQRRSLAEAARLFGEMKHNKVPADVPIEFDTEPLRTFLEKRGPGPAAPFEENCPPMK